MLLDRYQQQINERRQREILYARWLAEGESIVSVASWCNRISGTCPEDVPFEQALVTYDGDKIKYYATGGANHSTYKITFQITTNAQIKEDEVLIDIREI